MHTSKETVIDLDEGDIVVVRYKRRSVSINGGNFGNPPTPQMWLTTTDKLVVEFGDLGDGPSTNIVPDEDESIISMQVVAKLTVG